MVHVVGIVGINGNVGAPTSRLLVKAAEQGKIKLVLFYRESSTNKNLPTGQNVEARVLNLEDPPEKIEAVVRGINVFISTVGFGALPTEPNVIDALARSPDLVTYIPSAYTTTWDAADFQEPPLGPMLDFMHTGWQRAKQLDMGVTALYVGSFVNYFFTAGFAVPPSKENTVWANEKLLQNPFPVTTLDHIAEALARIATSDPQSIKNKEFAAVSFWPTGQDLVELYTKLNGEQTRLKELTEADRETMRADMANFGPVRLGYLDRWESNNWDYGRGEAIEYSGPDLEEVARSFL